MSAAMPAPDEGAPPTQDNVWRQGQGQGISSKFHFVDLAGSERASKTGNRGERFKGQFLPQDGQTQGEWFGLVYCSYVYRGH